MISQADLWVGVFWVLICVRTRVLIIRLFDYLLIVNVENKRTIYGILKAYVHQGTVSVFDHGWGSTRVLLLLYCNSTRVPVHTEVHVHVYSSRKVFNMAYKYCNIGMMAILPYSSTRVPVLRPLQYTCTTTMDTTWVHECTNHWWRTGEDGFPRQNPCDFSVFYFLLRFIKLELFELFNKLNSVRESCVF